MKREFSSAGSEHLPYKQRVGGSNPSTPTTISYLMIQVAFFVFRGGIEVGFPLFGVAYCDACCFEVSRYHVAFLFFRSFVNGETLFFV